ncbi:MAG: Serine/threonine kinase [Myxococcaceae bacterium]|jgi:sulfatase modifying factor 1|nr:Serine/threonine kinase [Myxococcaceae bacterium]
MTTSIGFLGGCALAALGMLCSCGLAFDLDALGSHAGGDAALEADTESGADAAVACPSLHGPPMVDADGQCIDATEVTVADYEPFVATGTSVLPAPEPCNWLSTLEPLNFAAQRATPQAPVVNLNFCHAFHYCKWAGKRLCGRIGGGAVALGDAGADPRVNQWTRACTHDGLQAYSYGSVVSVLACPNKIGPVKARSACAGPYPGLFDMLGNAGEWIDACAQDGTTRPRDGCTVVGFEHLRDEGSCYDLTEVPRSAAAPDLGFRCCGP